MSKRFGRNQRRKMRARIATLEWKLNVARIWLEKSNWWATRVPRAHRSHRTYFGGEQCMNCGCMVGSPASLEPCQPKGGDHA